MGLTIFYLRWRRGYSHPDHIRHRPGSAIDLREDIKKHLK
jgi:hypothetical protein